MRGSLAGHAGTPRRSRAVPRLARFMSCGIFAMDAVLRRWYGVHVYSTADNVLLRIALTKSSARVVLEDGTLIMPGDPVIDLHIWNERVPALGLPEHSLVWACRVKNRIQASLRQLAHQLNDSTELHGYVAVHAEAIALTARSARRFARLAARFGLVQSTPAQPADWGRGMLSLLLRWACNPGGAAKRRLRPVRQEFWISTTQLRLRYLNGATRCGSCTAIPDFVSSSTAFTQRRSAPVG